MASSEHFHERRGNHIGDAGADKIPVAKHSSVSIFSRGINKLPISITIVRTDQTWVYIPFQLRTFPVP
jgi:hypothetical protein